MKSIEGSQFQVRDQYLASNILTPQSQLFDWGINVVCKILTLPKSQRGGSEFEGSYYRLLHHTICSGKVFGCLPVPDDYQCRMLTN